MQIQILRDEAARTMLAAGELSTEWERLYGACPWASVFQSPAFVRTWYDVYGPTHAPVLVLARGAGGALRGLLTLADPLGGGSLVAAGAQQAEYQVWLTAPEDGDAFPRAAFAALGRAFRGRMLLLQYIPAAAPASWLEDARRDASAYRTWTRTETRPYIDLSDLSSVEKLLTGEYYRRRQNWLKRNGGEIRIERVRDPAAFDALLEEFMPLCDLRQGARYGQLPFRDDPLRQAFLRALVREGGVLEVTVLRAGDRLASVHIDACNRGEAGIGLLAHDPSLSRGSPGALHNLYLARELARDGWRALDLTPGGAYKEELANRSDDTRIVRVYFGARAHALWTAKMRVRGVAKRLVARAGASSDRARERVELLAAAAGTPGRTLGQLARRAWSSERVELYAIDADAARALSSGDAPGVAADDLAALGAYRAEGALDEPRGEFLSAALRRLEGGQRSLTRVDGDALAASAWVATGDKPVAVGGDDLALSVGAGVALLYDVRIAGRVAAAPVLRAMVAAAAEGADVRRIVVAVRVARGPIAVTLEQLGLARIGSLVRAIRFGRVWQRTTIDGTDVKLAAPAEPKGGAAPTSPTAAAAPAREQKAAPSPKPRGPKPAAGPAGVA